MPDWFDAVLFGATLPFRVATEVVLAVPTVTTCVIGETICKIVDSDHEWDITNKYEEVRDLYGKVATVGLGVGAIVASGGVGLVVAGAAATCSASNMNQKCEKILDGNCSKSEEAELRIGVAFDALGVVGNAAKIGMDGLGIAPNFLGTLKLAAATVSVPYNLAKKITPEAYARYQKMSMAEQAIAAAELGLSTYKFQMLLEELARLFCA
jgi:hypothetical protein